MERHRRDFLKLAISAAVGGRELVRASDARADILPETSWHEGIDQLMLMTEEKNLEHGDTFFMFKNGATRWADHKFTRSRISMERKKFDWSTLDESVAKNGLIQKMADIHVHGNKTGPRSYEYLDKKGRMLKAVDRGTLRREASPPSSTDIRSLMATRYLFARSYDDIASVPKPSMRDPDTRFTSLVLNVHLLQGWYYEAFPEALIKSLYPNVSLAFKEFRNTDPEYLKRLESLQAQIFEFQNTSLLFGGDVVKMRKDPDGARVFEKLCEGYANVGVVIRHVTYRQLRKEPPAAGVMHRPS